MNYFKFRGKITKITRLTSKSDAKKSFHKIKISAKNQDQEKYLYVSLMAWEKHNETVESLNEGDVIIAEGFMKNNNWTNSAGMPVFDYSFEVVAMKKVGLNENTVDALWNPL